MDALALAVASRFKQRVLAVAKQIRVEAQPSPFPSPQPSFVLVAAGNVSREAGEEQRVWAEAGGWAVLPCCLSPQDLGSSLGEVYKRLSVRWERHGSSAHKVHRMVIKVTPSGLKIRTRSMMLRASMWDKDFLRGNFSLQVKPVATSDAGEYTAQVAYGSKVQHCKLKLDVVSVTANLHRPFVASEPVKLTCNATLPEKPRKIQWFHAGHLITTSGRFWSADQSLLISRSIGSDSGLWACQLTYAGGERVSATHHLQVIGFAEPTFPVVFAAVGSDAHLPCILNNNFVGYHNAKVAVRWSHMAWDDLKANSNPLQENNRNFSLYLPAVGPASAGQYRCEVSINGTAISKNVTLVIMTVIPSIEGPVLEGSHLLLTCNLSHSLEKLHVQWKLLSSRPRNGSKAASGSFERLSSGWTLEFSQVSPEDAGTWECSIHSTEGMQGAVHYHLEIAGAQIASPGQNVKPAIGKITYGLMTILFVLVVSITVLAFLRRKTHSLNFPALDRLVAAALPRKEVTDGIHEEKVLQID
ncbi:lymphocyte activation gene 3 protein [Eublepharis macularius]|uniref:Lymphocyte activation gene 3 protein n=1 Tax=Eublepharis macularius TaxID=481883 RepID=A0AA97KKP7_EUBMA|nr:lymphocyte activation gene 3 protein [Eublepharis macularius]